MHQRASNAATDVSLKSLTKGVCCFWEAASDEIKSPAAKQNLLSTKQDCVNTFFLLILLKQYRENINIKH